MKNVLVKALKILGYSIVLFIVVGVLSYFIKVNIVTGDDHNISSSASKEESKERNVFQCDVILKDNPRKIADVFTFDVTEAWLEKSWRSSYLWSTTLPDDDYTIRFFYKSNKELEDYIFLNPQNRMDISKGNGKAWIRIKKTELNDTLKFNVYRVFNNKFPNVGIVDSVKLILNR